MDTVIETKRIILSAFTLNDIDAVFEFGSNKTVNKYTGDVTIKSKDHAKQIIEKIYIKDYQKQGYGRFAAYHKLDKKIIGFAGLKYLPEFDETDIGFRFLPEYWNKGIATEVANEIIKFGFETLKLKRIIGIADPKNTGSCKVLEKIGMTYYKSDVYDESDTQKYNWYKIEKN